MRGSARIMKESMLRNHLFVSPTSVDPSKKNEKRSFPSWRSSGFGPFFGIFWFYQSRFWAVAEISLSVTRSPSGRVSPEFFEPEP